MNHNISKQMSLLDALKTLHPESSMSTLRSWLKEGRVCVDGEIQKIGKIIVKEGQTVSVQARSRRAEQGIQILYEDDHLVVIDKPDDLLSVSTPYQSEKTAHSILKNRYRPKRVYVVHRLDQGTSGILVFALTELAFAKLKELFKKHEVERHYVAIVEGHLKNPSGTWESYLFEDPNYHVHSTLDKKKGELAVTHYEVRGKSKKHSWLDLKLQTGKKNQIRVHCQDAEHSIVGDKKYGATSDPINRLCLHAYFLGFKHPATKKMMRFESPPPKSFLRIVTPEELK